MLSDQSESPRIIAMHPALVPDFERWLASRGLELRPTPMREWIITPTDERLAFDEEQT